MAPTATKQIVLAWTEDMGEQQPVKVVKACMWRRRGTDEDVAKATKYCDGPACPIGTVVFTYDVIEKDPLAAAKRDVLARCVQKVPT